MARARGRGRQSVTTDHPLNNQHVFCDYSLCTKRNTLSSACPLLPPLKNLEFGRTAVKTVGCAYGGKICHCRSRRVGSAGWNRVQTGSHRPNPLLDPPGCPERQHAIGEQPHPTPLRLHCHRSRTTGARTIAAATLHVQPLSVIPGTTSVTPTNCEMTQCYKSVH